jgi:S1-C subfamily serine protease
MVMRNLRWCAVAVAIMLLTACSLRLEPGGQEPDSGSANPEPLPSVTFNQTDQPPPHSSVADTIERVLPSVVNVRVTAINQDVFGDLEEAKGQGSGVVIDRRGVILTNNHVVQRATEVTVVLNDGRRLDGTVVDTAPERDLAVVRVDADDLTPIELGKSSSVRLGDEVIAIGFPLGLGGATVTKGIVSALNRRIDVDNTGQSQELTGLMQTDAAINPGNSGGALVDLNGRLVGINTAAAGAGFAENIGFAIAIDSAIPTVQEILTEPPEERAWLGVYLDATTPALNQELGLDPDTEGALIAEVVAESPAADAGMQQGEVISAANGEPVTGPEELIERLTEFDPGDSIDLEVIGQSGSRELQVELVQRPPAFDTPEN